jgi:type II secretory pathway pseudopilin PulG
MRFELRFQIASVRGRASGQEGFTLIEAVLAMTLFVIVAAALGGVLTSAISASKVARERTISEQYAMDQIESIRRLPYDQVGTTSGNPPGSISPTRAISVRGLHATLTTLISYVNDPTPTSYATSANYKRVTVTVTRNDTGKQLARQVTYVAPPARAPYGGLNQAIIEATVVDYALNVPVPGARVDLATGPSAPRNDLTDDPTGKAIFAALTPNPVSGPTAYYDLSASKTGYVMFADPIDTHVQVAPGETKTPGLKIYKPATIVLDVRRDDGTVYTGDATVQITSGLTGLTNTFTVSGGTLAVTSLGGQNVVPGVDYTVEGTSPDPLCAPSQTSYVPDGYPNTLSETFTLTLGDCPSGGVDVTVEQLGNPYPGATVTLSGGPNNMFPVSGTTDSNGFVSFTNVPSGDGYQLQATNGTLTATQTVSVALNTVTTTIVTLPDPPGGNVNVTATWAGVGVANADVTLTGGPYNITRTGVAATGTLLFPSVPAGSGYSVSVTKTGALPTTMSVSGLSVSVGGTTPATLTFTPTKSVVITVMRGTTSPVVLANATVGIELTGGVNSPAVYKFSPRTTNSSGQVTVTIPRRASGTTTNYSIKVWHCAAGSNPRVTSSSPAPTISDGSTPTSVTVTINSSITSAACTALG